VQVNFKTKNELVYEALREDILNGKLKPGEKIVISRLAKAFGISGIPIREAIKKLESEGLLEVTPHVGTKVTQIEGDEFIGIHLIRVELESLATRLATPLLQQEDLDFLEDNIQAMEKALKQKDYGRLPLLNREFHLRIYKAVPYPYLFKLIVTLYEKINRVQSVFVLVPPRGAASIEEHRKILEAIRNKDATLAGRLVRRQKGTSLKVIMNFLQKRSKK
jgi:DNA-binding GntR family transcriptional regulator